MMVWRGTMGALATAGAALAWFGMRQLGEVSADSIDVATRAVVLAAGLGGLAFAFVRLSRHFAALEALRLDIAQSGERFGLDGEVFQRDDEVGAVAEAIQTLGRRRLAVTGMERTGPAALASLFDEPLLMVDRGWTITEANPAALQRLGIVATPGGAITAVFEKTGLVRALERARMSGDIVPAVLYRPDGGDTAVRVLDLGLETGAAVLFSTAPVVRLADGMVSIRPLPRAARLNDDEPLVAIPLLCVWTQSVATPTGEERLAAFGCVRLSGPRVFHTVTLDLRFEVGEGRWDEVAGDAGMSIEGEGGRRPFVACWRDIARMVRGCVLIGITIDAQWAAVVGECARADLEPPEAPPLLDLGRLASVLDGGEAGRDLASLRDAFSIQPQPRFGPFSAAHEAADLASAVIGRLVGAGITTLGAARAAAAR